MPCIVKIIVRSVIIITTLCLLAACGGSGGSDNSAQIQSQQVQIAALQAQLATVQTQNQDDEAAINAAITQLGQIKSAFEQLAAQSAGVQKSAVAIKTAGNQLQVLQSLVDSLTATSQNVATACAGAQASLADLTSQLNAAKAQVASLTAQLADSQGGSGDLAAQLATANVQVTSLTSQLAAANAQVTSLTSQLAAANNQVTSLSSQLTAANNQVASLTSQLATVNVQITTLTGQITTLTSAAATLQTQLDTANSTIADRDAIITSLNSTIATLNATITNMVATPVAIGVSSLTAVVSTNITVTASFPVSQASKTATFSATGGSLGATSVTIAGDGTASTTFSSASTGSFNIYAVQGLYAGGVVVTITAIPPATYSISGTISLNGVGQSGIIVALTGAATNAATTDASGNYSFSGLANGSYTVTPWPGSYLYPATSLSVTISNANATGKNFYNRWFNNNNGTVTDMTTGLVWLKNANCTATVAGINKSSGKLNWDNAQTWAAGLATGTCGLSDGSTAGSWRVPTLVELGALTNGTESVHSATPRLFDNIQAYDYWSSTTHAGLTTSAWYVDMDVVGYANYNFKDVNLYVWPVRAGQ